MGDAFSDGHDTVIIIDFAAEKNGVNFGCEAFCLTKLQKPIESFFMVIDQFIQPFMGPAKWNPVRWTDEDIFGKLSL